MDRPHIRATLTVFALILTIFTQLSLADTTPSAIPYDSFVYTAGTANITVALNVPDNSTDQLFFYYIGPQDQQWNAFGFGDQMAGSLIFVIYPATENGSLTVSPRIATGHSMPEWTNSVNVTLLPGSGTSQGVNVVAAMCTGCRSWNGGKVDVTSTSQSMIWAVGPGPSNFASDDLTASIQQHPGDAMGTFNLNLQKATGAAGVPGTSISTPPSPGAPASTSNTTTTPIGNDGSNASTPPPSMAPIVLHALVGLVAFVVIFPGGYLFLRIFNVVWVHMGVQTIGAVCVLAGAISGILISHDRKIYPKLNSPHQIIGLTTTFMVLTAWILGFVGHRIYKRTGAKSPVTKVHRFVGPTAILLGLVNGGVGFAFAGKTQHNIPYGIIVGLMLAFVGSISFCLHRRKVRKDAENTVAAQNFQSEFTTGPQSISAPFHGAGQSGYFGQQRGVPMQTFTPDAPPKYAQATVYAA